MESNHPLVIATMAKAKLGLLTSDELAATFSNIYEQALEAQHRKTWAEAIRAYSKHIHLKIPYEWAVIATNTAAQITCPPLTNESIKDEA